MEQYGRLTEQQLMDMNNLAIRYSAVGDINKARPLFESCLQRRRDLGLATHKDTVGVMYNLANLYSKNNLNKLAIPMYEDALKILRANPSTESRQVIDIMNNLSISLGEEGMDAQAEDINKEALKISKEKLGLTNPLTLDTWYNLAIKTVQNCKHAEAVTLLQELVVHQRRVLGDNHPDTINSTGLLQYLSSGINNLFSFGVSNGAAVQTYTESSSADQLKEQGNKCLKEGKHQEAVDYYTRAIILSPENEVIYSNRSAVHMKLQNYDQALADAKKCVELKPNWVKGHFRMGLALRELGQYNEALNALQISLSLAPATGENRNVISKEFEETMKEKIEFDEAVALSEQKEDAKTTVTTTGISDVPIVQEIPDLLTLQDYKSYSEARKLSHLTEEMFDLCKQSDGFMTREVFVELLDSVQDEQEFEKRGVTLKLLQKLRDYVLLQSWPASSPAEVVNDGWTVGAVAGIIIGNHEILKPNCRWGTIDSSKTLTGNASCSLIELLKREHSTAPHPTLGVTYSEVVGSKANVFISFAYKSNFIELVGAIERFVASESLLDSENTHFWFDPVVNDQWTATDKDFTWWATTFKDAISKINHTLMFMTPWDNPEPLTRAWCLFELFATVSTGSKFNIAMSKGDADNFMNSLMTNGYSDLVKMLATIDVRKSSCWNPDDKVKIFNAVHEVGFDRINSLVFQLLRNWVVATCKQALEIEESDSYQRCNLTNCLGMLLMNQGKFSEAEELFLEVAEKYPFTQGNHSMLIDLYFRTGQYKRAGSMQKDYLAIVEEEHGASGSETINAKVSTANMLMERQHFDDALQILRACLSLNLQESETRKVNESLGILYMKMGLLDEGLDLQLEGLAYLRKQHGDNERHPSIVAAMHNLAGVYSLQGDFKSALPLLETCYNISNETHGSEHPTTLLSLQGLATTHGLLSNYQIQAELLQKCYHSQVAIYGEANGYSLDTKLNLARSSLHLGGVSNAVSLFQSVIDTTRRNVDGNGSDYTKLTAEACHGIGQAYAVMGRFSEAHEAYNESLFLTRRSLGVEHPTVLKIMGDVVNLHIERGEFVQGKTLAEHCLKLQHKVLRKGHPDILVISVSLGSLYMELGQSQQALDLLTDVYSSAIETFGETHDICGNIQGSIGRAHRLLGNYEKAEDFMILAVETLKKTVGAKHADTLGVMSVLANMYNTYLRRYDQAKPIYLECLRLQVETLGTMHPSTLLTKSNLASLYCNIGEYSKGKAMLEECFEAQRQVLGADHPNTQITRANLNSLSQIM